MPVGQITFTTRAIPARKRGVGHRHERWGGKRGTRQRWRATGSQGRRKPVSDQGAQTNDVAADGKNVWWWHPLVVSKRREGLSPTGFGEPLNRRRRVQDE